MRALSRPTAVYVVAVIAGGVAILTRSAPQIPLTGTLAIEIALFLLLGVAAEIRYVSLGHRAQYSVSTAVNFAAVIIFGPHVAVWVSATSSAAGDLWGRKPLYKVGFNAALLALCVVAGAAAMEATRAAPGAAPLPTDLPAFALYGVVNTGVNYALLCTVIGLETRVWPWQVARRNFEGVSLPIVALYPLGVLMAVAYDYFGRWVGLLLLAVPMVAVYNALNKAKELRAQTERTLEAMAAREAAQRRLAAQAEELARRDAEAAALRELDRLKNEFIGTISHELRTPLTIVQCYADLLFAHFDDMPAERVTMAAAHMFDSATQLARLIDDLLDFARAEQGTLSIHAEDVDLVPLLQHVLASYRHQPGGDRLVANLPTQLAAHADGGRVTQVIANLIDNALKYAPSGPILVRTGMNDGQIRIEVEDRGPGIDPQEQPRVWEKFFRGQEVAATNRVRGSGIGLAVVRTLIEAHDGQVGLESAPDQGARFWFTLPAATEGRRLPGNAGSRTAHQQHDQQHDQQQEQSAVEHATAAGVR